MLADFCQTFPLANATALASGKIKQLPEDFIVDEQLSFTLTGTGEHSYVRIRKSQTNTQWLVKQLARHFGCPARDIGYAGLKDRQALTTQWFSIPTKAFTEGKAASFVGDDIEILEVTRHSGKLRRGAILQNTFCVLVRDVTINETLLAQRMALIASHGVPNYFGEQRFGIERNNLSATDNWFHTQHKLDRFKRAIYLSTARAWLFNLVLAERVRQDNWSQPLTGDVYMLEGSKGFFYQQQVDEEIRQRIAEGDIHPSAPLWGEGELVSTDAARALEERVLADWYEWRHSLEQARLKQQRRATRVIARALSYRLDPDKNQLLLEFALPAGCYATGLLREVVATSGGELELVDE